MEWRIHHRRQVAFLTNTVLFLLFACLGFSVHGDELILTVGQTISGRIIKETEKDYTVLVGSVSLNISKAQVQRVERVDRLTNLLALGDRLTSAGIYGKAVECYQEAISLSPDKADIQRRISRVRQLEFQKQLAPVDEAFADKNYGDAANLYTRLLEQFPEGKFSQEIKIKLSEVYCYRAEIAMDRIDYTQATEFLQKALDLNPGSTNAHLVMAKYELQHYRSKQKAEREFQLALASDPTNPVAKDTLQKLSSASVLQLPKLTAFRLPEYDASRLEREVTRARMYERMARVEPPIITSVATSQRSLSILLQAYNAGPREVLVYRGNVPYRETRNYVPKVLGYMKQDLGSTPYDHLIYKYARKYGHDPAFIKAVIKQESNFNPHDVTNTARGLMQVVPEDWEDTIKRLDVDWDYETEVFDPEKNIEIGCHYFRWLKKDFLPKYFDEFRM